MDVRRHGNPDWHTTTIGGEGSAAKAPVFETQKAK